jgi:GAF domain-containing protein
MPEIPPLALNLTQLLAAMPESPPASLSPFTFTDEVATLDDADFLQFLEEDALFIKSAVRGPGFTTETLTDLVTTLTGDQRAIALDVYLRQAFQLADITHSIRDLLTVGTLQEFASKVESEIRRIFLVSDCLVWLFVPSANILMNHSKLMKYPVGQGLIGTCAAEKRDVLAPNPTTSPLYSEEHDYPFCEDAQMIFCSPITHSPSRALIAVVTCINKYDKGGSSYLYWPQCDRALFQVYTERLSRGFLAFSEEIKDITRIFKLYGRLLTRQHDFIHLIAHIRPLVIAHLNCEDVSVFLKNDDNFVTEVIYRGSTKIVALRPIKLGVARRVVETGASVNIAVPEDDNYFDATADGSGKLRGVIAVPLTLKSAVIGVLVARGKRESPAFSDADLNRLTFIAAGVPPTLSFSLQARRKALELRAAVRTQNDLAALLQTAEALSRETDLLALNRTILQNAKNLVHADRASLFVVDDSRTQLISQIADGTSRRIFIPITHGLAGAVATTGEAINIRDCYSDPRFNSTVDKQTGYVTRSLMTIPVRDQLGRIIAVAQLMNKQNGEAFTNADVELASALSIFTGIALANSNVIQAALAASKDMRAMQELLGLVNSCARVHVVLNGGLRVMVALLVAERAAFFFLNRTGKVLALPDGRAVVPLGTGLIGSVAASGEPASVAVVAERDAVDDGEDGPIRSALAVPVRGTGVVVLGVVLFVNKDQSINAGAFTAHDRELASAMGVLLAIALERHKFEDPFAMTVDRVLQADVTLDRRAFAQALSIGVSDIDLVKSVASIFTHLHFFQRFGIGSAAFGGFVLALRDLYQPAGIYTWRRTVMSAHFVCSLILGTEIGHILPANEQLQLIVAVLCRNADRQPETGFTNIGLEVVFQDRPAMEMHQCEAAVNLMADQQRNILAGLPPGEVAVVWDGIFRLILATNMAEHFEIVEEARRLTFPHVLFKGNLANHRGLLTKMLLKLADVFWTMLDFPWAEELAKEAAGALGDTKVAANQAGLILFVARPLVAMVAAIAPRAQSFLAKCEENLKQWQKLRH